VQNNSFINQQGYWCCPNNRKDNAYGMLIFNFDKRLLISGGVYSGANKWKINHSEKQN
jgi:hypothetical protein